MVKTSFIDVQVGLIETGSTRSRPALRLRFVAGGALVVALVSLSLLLFHVSWLGLSFAGFVSTWHVFAVFIVALLAPLWLALEVWIFRPLSFLTWSNDEIARGRLETALIPKERIREDEMGALMRSRNAMLDALLSHQRELKDREHALAEANRELEGRVEDQGVELQEMHLLEEELAIARRIQKHLLPERIPIVEGFELAGVSRPSRGVSGDYFDMVKEDSGRVWVALGDVSGKGMPAALTMATLRALFRAELEREQPLGEAMRRISEGLYLSTTPEVFATFCFGVLDPADRSFTYVNAGHPYPLVVCRQGESVALDGAGPPLGMDPSLVPNLRYDEHKVVLDPGDVLVIYSDGVTEAGAGREDMFGEERLRPAIVELRDAGAQGVQDGICRAVDTFLGNAPADDDLTLVVVAATARDPEPDDGGSWAAPLETCLHATPGIHLVPLGR